MRTSNPALRAGAFTGTARYAQEGVMTVEGTVNKSFMLLTILLVTAYWTWTQVYQMPGLLWLGVIGGFVLALVTIFKKEWAKITAPLYAVCQGLALGGISALFEAQYQGIVTQAVFLTFAVFLSLLMAYKSGLIKVTAGFRLGVFAATGGIALVYLATLILGFFNVSVPFVHGSSAFSIGFSVFVVIIAALNLALDFDFIARASANRLPKYMEWYAAFALMVTLVWLYLEILRLLSKTRRR